MADVKHELIANGNILELSEDYGYVVTYASGIGIPDVAIITERGPLQHGTSYVDYRMGPRMVQLAIQVQANTIAEAFEKRQTLMLALGHTGTPLIYRLTVNDLVYQLNCYYNGGLRFDGGNSFFNGVMAIELYAPEPAFYDPVTRVQTTYASASSGDTFVVPLVVPVEVGSITANASFTVPYGGTWLEHPIIRVTGPIVDFKIVNSTTGETLHLDGITLTAGQWREIDCRYGHKTVVDQAAVNKIAELSNVSDLATFHLAQRRAGETTRDNSLVVTGTGGSAATQFDMIYYHRFLGV